MSQFKLKCLDYFLDSDHKAHVTFQIGPFPGIQPVISANHIRQRLFDPDPHVNCTSYATGLNINFSLYRMAVCWTKVPSLKPNLTWWSKSESLYFYFRKNKLSFDCLPQFVGNSGYVYQGLKNKKDVFFRARSPRNRSSLLKSYVHSGAWFQSNVPIDSQLFDLDTTQLTITQSSLNQMSGPEDTVESEVRGQEDNLFQAIESLSLGGWRLEEQAKNVSPASEWLAHLSVQGPGIVFAGHVHWPKGIFPVNPFQKLVSLGSNQSLCLHLGFSTSSGDRDLGDGYISLAYTTQTRAWDYASLEFYDKDTVVRVGLGLGSIPLVVKSSKVEKFVYNEQFRKLMQELNSYVGWTSPQFYFSPYCLRRTWCIGIALFRHSLWVVMLEKERLASLNLDWEEFREPYGFEASVFFTSFPSSTYSTPGVSFSIPPVNKKWSESKDLSFSSRFQWTFWATLERGWELDTFFSGSNDNFLALIKKLRVEEKAQKWTNWPLWQTENSRSLNPPLLKKLP